MNKLFENHWIPLICSTANLVRCIETEKWLGFAELFNKALSDFVSAWKNMPGNRVCQNKCNFCYRNIQKILIINQIS